MNKELNQIQRGELPEILASAEDAKRITNECGMYFPKKTAKGSYRKISKNIWNRNLFEDFSDYDTIKHCILHCMVNYRTNDDKNDEAFKMYRNFLKLPFYSKFEPENISNIWNTLGKWNMNTRGAELSNFEKFSASLQDAKNILKNLNQYELLDFINPDKQEKIKQLLFNAYNQLNLTPKNPFVTNSKTLHFLMPQLFIPIDRTYTVNYFTDNKGVDLPYKDNKRELVEWAFSMHTLLATLYNKYKNRFNELSIQTKTPITKLLDNMLIGFAMYRRHYCQQFKLKEYIFINGDAENRIE